MLFNSLVFLIFGAFFFLLWPLTRRSQRIRWVYITVASLIFYGWWDWRFIGLIVVNGLIDYFASLGMARFPRRKRSFLILSISANVGMLGTFKYLGFLLENVNEMAAALGFTGSIPLIRLTLPIGISFYTFQSMSYTIDVYRGRLKPTRSVFHFFAYLSMFPQLVAGPIVRAAGLLPQLEQPRSVSPSDRWTGLQWIVYGYFKKMVIADNVAVVVNNAFVANVADSTGIFWWMAVTLFAAQIYCDFSGYSDIARGLGIWMGYTFPKNFNHPYVSSSVQEFWQRWHISLSTWFRDYVYIPLGGSRKGVARSHLYLWITMVVSGLWHGAAWTFVIWGAIHAFFASVERLTQWPQRVKRFPGGHSLATLFVLVQVWVAWVFFRATSATQAFEIVRSMFDVAHWDLSEVPKMFAPAMLAVPATGVLICRELSVYLGMDERILRRTNAMKSIGPLFMAVLIAMCVFLRGPGEAFIYFQF